MVARAERRVKIPPGRRKGAVAPGRRIALVTGAGRGIGRAIACRLARDGAMVFVNYRSDRVAALGCVAEIIASGGAAQAVRADVSDAAQVRNMLARVRRDAGGLDILVANAGVAPLARTLAAVTPSMWRRTMETNATGAFFCAQAAAPMLARSGSGRIVFIGSVAARLGGNIGPHYAASKAALRGLCSSMGRELAPSGITVNVVEPGYVATDLSEVIHRSVAMRRRMRAEVPLERTGTVEEVADVVAFLAGPGGSYVTRECIAVAGGR